MYGIGAAAHMCREGDQRDAGRVRGWLLSLVQERDRRQGSTTKRTPLRWTSQGLPLRPLWATKAVSSQGHTCNVYRIVWILSVVTKFKKKKRKNNIPEEIIYQTFFSSGIYTKHHNKTVQREISETTLPQFWNVSKCIC